MKVENMKVVDLKRELKSRGLSGSGRKAELKKRLLESIKRDNDSDDDHKADDDDLETSLDDESSSEIKEPSRKRRKLNKKKGIKSTKTPLQRLGIAREKWYQIKAHKEEAISGLEKKQKRELKKMKAVHAQRMSDLVAEHDEEIANGKENLEEIMQEIEEDSDAEEVIFCRVCYQEKDEEEIRECTANRCDEMLCGDCGTACTRCCNPCGANGFYCSKHEKEWLDEMQCGALICIMCQDYHYKDRCGIRGCKAIKLKSD